ncbi:MAG TPA: peptide deformylase [Verrucomicrobiota bacterium]|nr:peptide deformylase [Verrucomicrobiota bacterium]HRT08267.1 peptide deformylase [Candidatus Paceibacterota bacterium]HRT57021.1 peptide deformylase [Candidatus Paceibacterota bacterium]
MNSSAPDRNAAAQPPAASAGPPAPVFRLSLVYYPDPVLRVICAPVETFDTALRDTIEEMFALMRAHAGIGLAGPQVAIERQLLVCGIGDQQLCLINPALQESSEPADSVEGCLSLPGVQVKVRRPERIRVSGYDPRGRKTSFAATGLWARVIQHEMDHLNGVLICDYRRPSVKECDECPLSLPAVLVEERKHRMRPSNLL